MTISDLEQPIINSIKTLQSQPERWEVVTGNMLVTVSTDYSMQNWTMETGTESETIKLPIKVVKVLHKNDNPKNAARDLIADIKSLIKETEYEC